MIDLSQKKSPTMGSANVGDGNKVDSASTKPVYATPAEKSTPQLSGPAKEKFDTTVAMFEKMRGAWKDKEKDFFGRRMSRKKHISTGFKNIDRALGGGLVNELYIMAAETSTGKSAFYINLAEQIAESGQDVLYFALEMDEDEIMSRGISRISHIHHLADKGARQFTQSDIALYTYDKSINEYVILSNDNIKAYADEYFSETADHLYIFTDSAQEGWTAKKICQTCYIWKEHYKKTPIVIIDYLQLIAPDKEDRSQSDRKTKLDISVRLLKTLASQVGMPVLTISSISRGGYHQEQGVTLNTLKESGDLEYTGGVILGWNWLGVTTASDESSSQNREDLDRERGYRCMRLDVLKNRKGERSGKVELTYYPAYDFFAEKDTPEFKEYDKNERYTKTGDENPFKKKAKVPAPKKEDKRFSAEFQNFMNKEDKEKGGEEKTFTPAMDDYVKGEKSVDKLVNGEYDKNDIDEIFGDLIKPD